MNVRSILEGLGYSLADDGEFYRTSALYRGGGNPTAMSVRKSDGMVYDFGRDTKFPIKNLVKQSLRLGDKEAEEWIGKHGGIGSVGSVKPKPKIKKTYDPKLLERLGKSYQLYDPKKNISEETLKFFRGGVAYQNEMQGRFVFPVLDAEGSIVGWAGRDLYDKKIVKWKILGQKRHFVYPYFLNQGYILKEREIILVESIGDMLKLWDAGIRTALVLFGLSLLDDLFSTIVSANPARVIVATNNEYQGGKASEKIAKRLHSVFDKKSVIEAPPAKNDFGDMTTREIVEWHQKV